MASEDLKELIRLGPFLGVDKTTAELFVQPGMALEAINVNTQVIKGALAAERGRTELFDAAIFDFGGSFISQIDIVIPCVLPANKPAVLFQGVSVNGTVLTGFWTYTGSFTNVTNARKFTQAVQMGQVVYTNGGQRLFLGSDNTKMYEWQYGASDIAQNLVINWTYAIATLGFNGYIKAGDVLTINITSSAAATISYTVVDTDVDFDTLSKSITKAVNDYYGTGAGSTVANKITASPLVDFATALQPGTIKAGTANGVLLTSTASGNIGNTFTISVSSSAGATEGFAATGPTALGFFYGANVEVGNMTGGEYFYVLTQQTLMPDGTISETSVYPNDYANPIQVHVGGRTYGNNSAVTFSDTHAPPTYKFTGTNPDGTTYTTNFYRQSENQAGYFLVGNKADNTTPFIDTSSDAEISGNAQLQVHRDPPPLITNSTFITNQGFICIHHNRMWVFVVVDNNDTTNIPQTQLWYSNFARPWEFDNVEQVLLLDSDVTTAPASTGPNYADMYGNMPQGMGEVGTTLICKKRREDWVVWGDGSTSNPFTAKPIFTYGSCSQTAILAVVGGMYFLDASGDLYFYDGGAPNYVSEDIRGAIKLTSINENVTASDLAAATLCYSNRVVYVSFPTLKYTLSYDTLSGKWMSKLPYSPFGSYGIATTVSNPTTLAGRSLNEVIAVRSGFPVVVDSWFADPDQDINSGFNTFSWTTPHTDCGAPDWRKWFAFLRVTAPPKQKGFVNVTITMGQGLSPQDVFVAQVDLSSSEISRTAVFKSSAPTKLVGYLAQVNVTVQGVAGEPSPIIWQIGLYGTLVDRLVVQA